MSSRHNRPIFEGQRQRGPDRRKTVRRKSDIIISLLKYVVVAAITAVVVKIMM